MSQCDVKRDGRGVADPIGDYELDRVEQWIEDLEQKFRAIEGTSNLELLLEIRRRLAIARAQAIEIRGELNVRGLI